MSRLGFVSIAALIACAIVAVMPTPEALGSSGQSSADFDRAGVEETMIELNDEMTRRFESRAVVKANLVLTEGFFISGVSGPITVLNHPFVNGVGDLGFTGTADESFVRIGEDVVWVDSDGLPTVLSGAEFTMGIGNSGEFIYSPSTDGFDSVWSDVGLLAIEELQAPGLPAGTVTTFHSRPTMVPSGQAFWIAGHGDGAGGTTTVGRVFYTSPDGSPGSIVPILRTGDTIGGEIIAGGAGIDFDYDVSDNAAHHIHALTMVGSSTTDGFLYVDGSLVAREGSPNGSGIDNWDNFDFVSINNSGAYVFSGDTDGDSSTDEFIAHNGTIVLREGATVDGVQLESGFSVRGVGINNFGEVTFGWGSSTTDHLFISCNASDLAATSHLVLSTGDELDTDGDGTGEGTVTDLPVEPIHSFHLADSGRFYVKAGVDFGDGEVMAIIGLDLNVCPLFNDDFESGTTSAWDVVVP